MDRAEAENVESLAWLGRSRVTLLLIDDGVRAAELRAMRGPDLAVVRRHDARPGEHKRFVRSIMNAGSPLSITLSSDLDFRDPHVVRLMQLARLDALEVYLRRDIDTAGEYVSLRRWRLEPPDLDGIDRTEFGAVMEGGDTEFTPWYGIHLQRGWRALADHVTGSDPKAEDIWIDLQVHQSVGTSLFVTLNPVLLDDQRHRDRGPVTQCGVASPREAVTVVETILRERGVVVPRIDGTHSVTFDAGSFRAAVSEYRIASVWAAMRSALAPARRDRHRTLADRLVNVLSIYEDLLVATDATAALRLVEGDRFGDNALLDRLLYHTRQAITLTALCLDCLTWLVTDLDGQQVDRHRVSWRALRDPATWVKSLADGRATRVARAVKIHPLSPRMDFIYNLRHAAVHRQPLEGASLHVRPSAQLDSDESCFAVGVVHLDESMKPDKVTVPPLAGVFSIDGMQLAMPHLFVAGIARDLATLLDAVLGSVAWPDDGDWWHVDTPEYLRRPYDQLMASVPFLTGEER